MDIRHIVRAGAIVVAAVLLLAFALAVAPKAPAAVVAPAFAEEAAPAAEGASATAAPAESAEPKGEEAKAGEAKKEKKEIPHTVGKPTEAQLADLRRAWDSIPGFDLLLVSILGMIVTVGIIGFGAFKQMKV